MQLVISIVSWNTRDLLRKCLSSLSRFQSPDARVVVIDNASSDGTPEMVREEFPSVQLVESGGNLGFGKAHNLVAAQTREPFLLFLNPDTEFIEDATTKMLAVFRDRPEVGMVGCQTVNGDGSLQSLGYQLPTTPWTELLMGFSSARFSLPFTERFLPRHDPASSGLVRKLYGGCLMVRREALAEVGWFDERFFMYGEDVDLSRRLESAGWRLYYLSTARVIHLGGGASEKAPGRFATLMQCESIARLMAKYYGALGRIGYRGAILARALARLTVALFASAGLWLLHRPSGAVLRGSRSKHLAMLKWSLGLERPVIPQ